MELSRAGRRLAGPGRDLLRARGGRRDPGLELRGAGAGRAEAVAAPPSVFAASPIDADVAPALLLACARAATAAW